MGDCGVCIGGFDGISEFYRAEIRIARRPHTCYECGAAIAVGQKYEYASGKSDGDFWSAHTCLICAEIGKAFSCEGRMHGCLWDDMEYCFSEITTGCFERLTTAAAKAELQRRWNEWKFERARHT